MCTDKTNETRTYSVLQVTQLIHVNKDTVHRMIKDGRLEAYKEGRKYRVTEESIKKLVKGNEK